MTTRLLSSEIVSLIHHVELNKSGWWKKAVGQVIKGVMWKAQGSLTLDELKRKLDRELGIPFSDEVLQRQIDYLVSQSAVTRMPRDQYKLTEQTHQALTVTHEAALANQNKCRSDFLDFCAQNCPELAADLIWGRFTQSLVEAIRVAGANFFHLLADGNIEREVDWLSRFLTQFPSASHHGLRNVISEFFAPANQACRSRVLSLLTAHFFAEASQLRPETIAAIEVSRKKRTIRVVLDTNFLFSVLQLHDNPADEAALSLIDIAQQNGNLLDIKLFVLPGTLEEAKKTLINQMRLVERVRTTSAMAKAALTQPLPSIAKRFFDAARRSPGLTSQTFFQPYIDDLRTILQGKGINVLDASPAIYKQRQEVIDDVHDEQEREKNELSEQRRKGYETLLHDVILWHAVKDRRADNSTSPFEVEYWAVSLDWRLIAFDKRKRSAEALNLPVVLYPSNLVQLIQFWVPRSEKLEQSLIDALRFPLFFQSFDPEDERATVKVLEAISRFENVGDISESTIKIVLANQALRERLRESEATNDEVFDLVREEMLAEHKEAVSALDKTKDSLALTEASLTKERGVREITEQKLGETNAQLENANQRVLEAEGKAAEKERIALAAETQLNQQRFAIFFWGLPLFLGVVAGYLAYSFFDSNFVGSTLTWGLWAVIAIGLLPLAISCLYSSHYVTKHPSHETWWLAKVTVLLGKKAIAVPGSAAFTAIYQGGVWDGVKSMFG